MTDKSKLIINATASVGNLGSFLIRMLERLYDGWMERAQMRLAPTQCIDCPPLSGRNVRRIGQ